MTSYISRVRPNLCERRETFYYAEENGLVKGFDGTKIVQKPSRQMYVLLFKSL